MLGTAQKLRDDKGIDGSEAAVPPSGPHTSWVGESHPWPPGAPTTSKKKKTSGSGIASGRATKRAVTPVRHAISGEWALKECEEHTTWVNDILQRNKFPLIGDLRKGLADGVTLVTIVELTTTVPVAKTERHPTTAGECEENLNRCLSHLEERGVDITAITAKDIADGNLKSTLTLLGNIRKKYDVYGERSEGDGGVAPPQGEIARQSMPGRLYTEGGGPDSSRVPPSPVKRERPSSAHRELNAGYREVHAGYYSPSMAQRVIPGMMGSDEQTIQRPASALPFTSPSEVNTGVSHHGVEERRQYMGGQWKTANVPTRPQSAREALGVGSEKPPFHVTNAWANSQRIRETPGLIAEKPPVAPRPTTQRQVQHDDGDFIIPPPQHSRNNSGVVDNVSYSRQDSNKTCDNGDGAGSNQLRWGMIGGQAFPGYVPSQPTDRKEGPRGESLFSRDRNPPPPYSHDHRVTEPRGEQYVNHAFMGDNSNDLGPSRRLDGAVNSDLRSACNKLYGSRPQTQDRQTHGSPAAQPRNSIDMNKVAYSPSHPHDFRKPSYDQIHHTARSSPMGQTSNNFVQLTESNTRSYTGQNATFSTFKPESDDEENEKDSIVEPKQNTLMPSAKYPENSGSRSNSARQTPVNGLGPATDRVHVSEISKYLSQDFSSNKPNDYYEPVNTRNTASVRDDHMSSMNSLASRGVSYRRESDSKPATAKVATMMNSTHINAAYVEDSGEESDRFRGTTNRNILDYAAESSGSITPPLPPLSPGSSRPATPPFNPKFGRSYSASNVSPPKTPDLLTSTSKRSVTVHTRASNPHLNTIGKDREHSKRSPRQKPGEINPERTNSNGVRVSRGNGLSHSLDDLRESGNESNISFDIENTFLTVEESEQDAGENFSQHKHAHASRRHMDQFEAMYQNMLQSVGVVKGVPHHKEHVHVKRRWSLASSDTSSLPKGRKFRGDRTAYEKGSAKDIKSIQRRFQRLESHVVTLARSVAHLSSELRHNNSLIHELEWIKRELRELRLENHHHPANPLAGRVDNSTEFERFRGWIPSLTNPKRVNKLTKFFGQEPPLLQLYLKKLGYERYSKNFENEHIGMIELPYMTEDRLESIGIPMGPRLRILQEAQLCFRQDNFNIYIV